MKIGQRVRLASTTSDMRADGLSIGMLGTVRETKSGALGVEFDGHSNTGANAGLHVVWVNTWRGGRVIRVIDLCKPVGNTAKVGG